jgi:transposase
VDVLVDRCAGLDVHQDTVLAVVRRPAANGSGREQEVRRYRTFTAALRELRAWLLAEQVTQVAMEATGVYWKPIWHVLEAEDGFELLRGSFVPSQAAARSHASASFCSH